MFFSMLQSAIRFSTVFLFGSTGETIVEKSGHLNLGIPGIMCIGATGGCIGARIYMNGLADPTMVVPFLLVLTSIIFAMIFAGAAGLVYGFMTISLRSNQNVTGLALTTLGTGVLTIWGTKAKASGVDLATPSEYFQHLFPDRWFAKGGPSIFLSFGPLVYLAIVIAIITTIVFRHTRVGLSLTAVGENPGTADAAGINVTGYKYVSCVLGAAIAGIGGLFYLMDKSMGSLEYVVDAMGWLAVALVIFSMWRPLLGIFGSIIFGFFMILPSKLNPTFAQMELFNMLPYAVTIIVLIVVSIVGKKETQPPTSLGQNYFREER